LPTFQHAENSAAFFVVSVNISESYAWSPHCTSFWPSHVAETPPSKAGNKFVVVERLFVPIGFSVLLLISGCSGVGGDVQAGRNALQTGRPNDAIGYLARAADADPNYKIPYRVRAGVLGYLGRAYLETGKDTEARQTLEKAVTLNGDDPFAHLYLGIAMLKTGERERGRKEIEVGLRAIDDTLEYIAADSVYGFYWDPGMQIRNDIRKSLAAKLDDAQLAMAGERIGRQFDDEIDKARRDEGRRGGGGESGGGGS
jgi:tetratricopeptide (TPR) repeat protein